jgi:hypothetical protein
MEGGSRAFLPNPPHLALGRAASLPRPIDRPAARFMYCGISDCSVQVNTDFSLIRDPRTLVSLE